MEAHMTLTCTGSYRLVLLAMCLAVRSPLNINSLLSSASPQDWVLYLGSAQRQGADAAALEAIEAAAAATGLPLTGVWRAKGMCWHGLWGTLC